MKKILLVLSLFILTASFYIKAETIDLFILAGQSNAHGEKGFAYTGNDQYPYNTTLDSQIRLCYHHRGSYVGRSETSSLNNNGSTWITMQKQQSFSGQNFGPEVTFARGLLNAGYTPAIFKYTCGATSIAQHWQTPGDRKMYDDMIVDLEKAIDTLESQGHTVNVRGFVWIQGESDSQKPNSTPPYTYSDAYEANFTEIKNDLRSKYPNLPMLIGIDEQHPRVQADAQVLNALEKIAHFDSKIAFVSMYSFEKEDVTHLKPVGLQAQGTYLAQRFTALLSGSNSTSSCNETFTSGTSVSEAKTTWGQSFRMSCNGSLREVTFNSASAISSVVPKGASIAALPIPKFTVNIRLGADHSGQVLHSQDLAAIVDGDNTIQLTNPVTIDKQNTYFFQILSKDNTTFKVRYDGTNYGNDGEMKTTNTINNVVIAERYYGRRDMNFSASVALYQQLPIALENFSLSTSAHDAVLSWTTTTEINNSHFNVQRSYDGIHFETIAEVAGAGDSYSAKEYSYTDVNVGQAHSSVYYRLQQVDFDGSSEVFKVLVATFDIELDAKMYPNPVAIGSLITIRDYAINTINVYNSLGKKVYEQSLNGASEMKLSTAILTKGIYFVIINGNKPHRIMVQ